MDENVGIKYFYDQKLVENLEVELKKHPSDFVVQEVAEDKLCGFAFIFDMVSFSKSIDFLYNLIEKNSVDRSYMVKDEDLNVKGYKLEELYLRNPFVVSDGLCKTSFFEFIREFSEDDLKINENNVLNFININLVLEIKRKWDEIKKSKLILDCGDDSKLLRTKIYKILNKIPFIKSKTIDGKINVEFSSEGVFRAVASKVMLNSMDVVGKISRSLNLKNGKVAVAGNKDKKAITFQEISVNANFGCIFEMAYELYDDTIIELLSRNYEDPLNEFFIRRGENQRLEDMAFTEDSLPNLNLERYNLINLINYLLVKFISGEEIVKETWLEIKNKVEAMCEVGHTTHFKSHFQLFNIERADIIRLGALKGNKFTIKLPTKEINKNTKFLNYFGMQRFGKCKNNHKIGEKILNKEYEKAVEMIIKNSKGYSHVCGNREYKQMSLDTDFKNDNNDELKSFETLMMCCTTELYNLCEIIEEQVKCLGKKDDKLFDIILMTKVTCESLKQHVYPFENKQEMLEDVERLIKDLDKIGEYIGTLGETEILERAIHLISRLKTIYKKLTDEFRAVDSDNNPLVFDNKTFNSNEVKEMLSLCDSTEKYVIMMKIKGKTDKNIIYGLKREIRMLYLHAYQSYFFNESINEEIEKNKGNLDDLVLPLKRFNDKMLKGGERKAVAECYSLKGKGKGDDYIVSFYLGTSSYATLAIREITGKSK